MPTFPYPDHRSMDQVLRDEAEGCTCELTEIHGDEDHCPIMIAAVAEMDAEIA